MENFIGFALFRYYIVYVYSHENLLCMYTLSNSTLMKSKLRIN